MELGDVKVLRPLHNGEVLESFEVKGVYDEYGVSHPTVRIVKSGNQLFYDIEEPHITKEQVERLRWAYRVVYYTLKPSELDQLASKLLDYVGRDPALGYYIVRDVVRYGVITTPLDDDEVEDVSFSPTGSLSPVYIYHREFGTWIPTNILLTAEEADFLVQKLAFKSGKSITLAKPILDATTPEGYRIAVTYKREVSPLGPTFSIRKPNAEVWTLSYMVCRRKVMPPLLAAALWFTLENRGVILVVGRSGVGKTTLINALLTVAPPMWKIVTVEEVPELRVLFPNWVSLVSRKPSLMIDNSDAVEVPLAKLIAYTFRIRPDLVSVGEVRTKEEMREFIHSVAAGHGGITAIHAEDFYSLKARFNYAGVDDSFFSLVTMIVFLNIYNVQGKVVRRVREVGEVVLENGEARYVPLATYDPTTDSYTVDLKKSRRLRAMASLRGMTEEQLEQNLTEKAEFLLNTCDLPKDEYVKRLREYYEKEGVW